MMTDSTTRDAVGAPAPGAVGHRYLLAFGVFASPLAWALALYALFALASHNCFPGVSPLPIGAWSGAWLLWLIALAALAVCIVAGLLSYRSWQDTYRLNASADAPVEFGKGRARFFAVWGALTSLLFVIVMLASLFPLFVVPICG